MAASLDCGIDRDNTRNLWLALLAPEVVETILAGRTDHALMLGRLERPLPASGEEQRRRFVDDIHYKVRRPLWTPLDPSRDEVALKGFPSKVMPSKFKLRSRAWW